jgi:hypothetical protein
MISTSPYTIEMSRRKSITTMDPTSIIQCGAKRDLMLVLQQALVLGVDGILALMSVSALDGVVLLSMILGTTPAMVGDIMTLGHIDLDGLTDVLGAGPATDGAIIEGSMTGCGMGPTLAT